MSYETAPATIMLATQCACCRRPLVDAVSIETGMGPVCRKRHGFNAADTAADWSAVAGAMLAASGHNFAALTERATTGDADAVLVLEDALRERLPECSVESWLTKNARELANAMVHRIAVEGLSIRTAPLVEGVRALGFATLANVLTDRAAAIRIERENGRIYVTAPFSERFLDYGKRIPSRRWVPNEGKKGGRTSFEAAYGTLVLEALRRSFPDALVAGPKGLFQLDAATTKEAA